MLRLPKCLLPGPLSCREKKFDADDEDKHDGLRVLSKIMAQYPAEKRGQDQEKQVGENADSGYHVIGWTIGADQVQEGAENHCQPSGEEPCRVKTQVLRHQEHAARGVQTAQHQQRPSENAVESFHGFGLSPKMAVPTRTQVEPSSIATSKSCDMPMESTSI